MRYVFIGAGAVGSALGGLLTRAGQDSVLVARGRHADALTTTGLHLRCPDSDVTINPVVATGPGDVRLTTQDVLVLTTKTPQAHEALAQWVGAPVHDNDGRVLGSAGEQLPLLTALNGVAGEDIALRFFERVFGVCVWFPAVMIEPGEVVVRGAPLRGIFHTARYAASPDPAQDNALLDQVRRDWASAALDVIIPASVMPWKYRKLLANLGNAVQALLGDASAAGDIAGAVEAEGREVLDAAGIEVTGEQEAAATWSRYSARPVPGSPEQLGGSSWQSMVRGTGSVETAYLNGEIALIARRLGRAAPLNSTLTQLAARAADHRTAPGDISAHQLRAQLGL